MNREMLLLHNPLKKKDGDKPSPSGGGAAKGGTPVIFNPLRKNHVISRPATGTATVTSTVTIDKPLVPKGGGEGDKDGVKVEVTEKVEAKKPPVSAAAKPFPVLTNGVVNRIEPDREGFKSTPWSPSPNQNPAKCTCRCEHRLQVLQGELKDLKSWKAGRQQFEDVISCWKEEVDKWLQSKFGFSISISASGAVEIKDVPSKAYESHRSETVRVLSPSTGLISEFIDEGEEERSSQSQSPTKAAPPDADPLELSSQEAEHMEIAPDIFGHFLLGGQDEDEDEREQRGDVETMEEDSYSDDGDDVEGPSINTRKNIQIIKMRMDDEYKDTDSDCYTVSEGSSDSEPSSSDDEEYMPGRRGGRGPKNSYKVVINSQAPSTSTSSQNARVGGKAVPSTSSTAKNSQLSLEARKELLKQCKPKPGNLWECNFCGFMLASLENMLLHVKYNHATSTHTCPFCRVVILCRSPKDAAAPQSTCKMRPQGRKVRLVPSYSFVPTPSPSTSSSKPKPPVPHKVARVQDIHAKVNKFVDDILEPNSKTATKYLNKSRRSNANSGKTPAIVTLSSDSGSDEED